MKKFYFISTLALLCAILFGCAAENSAEALDCWARKCTDDKAKDKDKDEDSKRPQGCNYYVDELTDAPHCYDYGETMWVKDEDKIYVCEDNGLTQEGYWNLHSKLSDCDDYVSTYNYTRPSGCNYYIDNLYDAPECRNYNETMWVKAKNTIYVCGDGMGQSQWIPLKELTDCDDYVPPWEESSSSSSTIPTGSSSSSNNSSSSSAITSTICGDLWCGPDGDYVVETGLDNGSHTSGYWFEFDDSEDGGRSSIIWPVAKGNEFNDYALDPVIDYCQGICGTASLNIGTLGRDPYVGIGFLIAGEEAGGFWDEADVSDWLGICVVYSSNVDMLLELSLGSEVDAGYGYDLPVDTLYQGEMVVQNLPWYGFQQRGFAKGQGGTIGGDQAATGLAALKFWIEGNSGSNYNFSIISIGKYGTCGRTGK